MMEDQEAEQSRSRRRDYFYTSIKNTELSFDATECVRRRRVRSCTEQGI